MTGGFPPGLPVVLDRDVRRLSGGRVLLGGDPGRLVRLRSEGADGLTRLAAQGGEDGPMLSLARSLVAGGLAHPRPRPASRDVLVVIPVLDRVDGLRRCLQTLGEARVLVVDDGSADAGAVARVCRDRGAQLLRLEVNAGPAAARNAGVAASSSDVIAFLDSDCVPGPGWLADLLGHFDDPTVGAVAPRVRAGAGSGVLTRYARARGPLDLGAREAAVRPGTRVPYVPTAALLVRRCALPALEPAGDGPFDAGPFDRALRYGEDVDLVWRLHDAGWTIRYDPRTEVVHAEPDRWAPWLLRRHRYGTSAAPLSRRHGARLTPLVLQPWPAATWLLLLGRLPVLAAAAAAVPAVRLGARLHRAGLPPTTCARMSLRATGQAVLAAGRGFGGAGAVVAAPLLAGLLVPRASRRLAATLLLAPPLLDWLSVRPRLDPLRWTAFRLVDDLAYAGGVWRSCLTCRTLAPLTPRRSRPS